AMSTITSARPGDEVVLAVDAQNATDGATVNFAIRTSAGDALANLAGTVAGGTARATWRVDVGGRALPLDALFTASLAGQQIASGAIHVTPRQDVAAVGWSMGSGVAPAIAHPDHLNFTESSAAPRARTVSAAVQTFPVAGGSEIDDGNPVQLNYF